MNIAEFDYDLPPGLIAQEPAPRRDASRLMTVDRRTGALGETTFAHLARFLGRGDLLVVNDTRVLPVRLRGRKPSGGAVELLLLPPAPRPAEPAAPGATCTAILSTSKGIRRGVRIDLGEGAVAEILEEPGGGRAPVRLQFPGGADLAVALRARGVMPLPPYIERTPGDARDALDRERYQTVFATADGAIAAPTAGLHFTPALLDSLQRQGIEVARLTLHVGPGTFLPVRTEAIEEHTVEPEWCRLPEETAAAIDRCRSRRGRVVAVGTTVTRVLEWRAAGDAADTGAGAVPGEGWCDLYIRPGHRFRVVDALLTNLHLPKSSLLILVAAFAGRERILAAYHEAVRRGFRFYSYGDAMLIA